MITSDVSVKMFILKVIETKTKLRKFKERKKEKLKLK